MNPLGRLITEGQRGIRQFFGYGEYTGRGGLKHNMDQLFDINNPGSFHGTLWNRDEGLFMNWDRWWDKKLGRNGGSDDDDDSTLLTAASSSSSGENNPTPDDPGLDDPGLDSPLGGDVQMSTYLAQKRRKIGNKKGRVDTMLTRGQDISDVQNRMMLS